ncbi:MAG TPA: AlpA family phage regulatory protein [Hyphomonas sp.]|nr:AlpA family phage regulatory protein [Hyphomonas sp.]HRX72652.1 AlpA family phage regulatory protein [Hyphomonas sp.]
MAKQTPNPLPRTIRRHELKQIVPLADSTIYEMEQRGEFPRRFALSPRCVVWDLAEVEAWLASRKSKPLKRAPHPDVRQRKARPVKPTDRAEAFPRTAEQ